MSRVDSRPALYLGLALGAGAAMLSGCAPRPPEPHTRIAAWSPQGTGVPRTTPVTVDFTSPIDAAGLAEGLTVALARAADARALAHAMEAGEPPGPLAVPTTASLADGGRRVELRPAAPLRGGTAYALLVATTLRDAEGRIVLDADGHARTFVATFTTEPGPPPRVVLTEVRAVAAPPQAGGEYVELLNLGAEPLDLSGWRLEKRTSTGTLAGCLVAAAAVELAPGAFGLVTSEAWDGRYGATGPARFTCGGGTLAGGLADDRAPELRLLDASGALQATFGQDGLAPRCPAAVERIDPWGADQSGNLACAAGEGTPGACNSVTPPWLCP